MGHSKTISDTVSPAAPDLLNEEEQAINKFLQLLEKQIPANPLCLPC